MYSAAPAVHVKGPGMSWYAIPRPLPRSLPVTVTEVYVQYRYYPSQVGILRRNPNDPDLWYTTYPAGLSLDTWAQYVDIVGYGE